MDYVVDTIHEKTDEWKGKKSAVLLMVGHNDCMYLQSFAQQHHSTDKDGFVVQVHRILRTSRVYRLLVQIIARFKAPTAATLIREPPPRLGSTQEARYCEQTLDSGISEINAWRLKHGHHLTLLSYPIPNVLNPQDKRPDHLLQVNYLVNQLLSQAAKKYDINWVDTSKCMAHKPRSFWEQDAVHLTNEGDVALAECLFNNIPLLSETR
jgi:lysophospholipase L1-like esterase